MILNTRLPNVKLIILNKHIQIKTIIIIKELKTLNKCEASKDAINLYLVTGFRLCAHAKQFSLMLKSFN